MTMKNNGAWNNIIYVMAQGFYGNRTITEVDKDRIDAFILGHMDNSIPVTEEVDRTIIHIPDTDIVVIYNKNQSEEWEKMGIKMLADVDGLKIYGRCIACRMNANGDFESIEDDDIEIVTKYFAA